MDRSLLTLAALVVAALSLAGCGSDCSSSELPPCSQATTPVCENGAWSCVPVDAAVPRDLAPLPAHD